MTFLLISGCATFVESVSEDEISVDDTLLYGRLEILNRKLVSGKVISEEKAEVETGSIAVTEYESPEDLPTPFMTYSKVKRLMVNEYGVLLVPISAGNYCLVDVHASLRGFGKFVMQDFSRRKGVNGTLIFSISNKAVNDVGKVTVIFATEEYVDEDGSGDITQNEFKSALTDFNSVSEGKSEFPSSTKWVSVSIAIDESAENEPKLPNIRKTKPMRIEYR